MLVHKRIKTSIRLDNKQTDSLYRGELEVGMTICQGKL